MDLEIKPLENPDLYGKGIVALTEETQDELNISKGGYVKTEGSGPVNQILRVATLQTDVNSVAGHVIQVGRRTRSILDLQIGEELSVSVAKTEPADHVTLRIEETNEISGPLDVLFKSRLKGRALFQYNLTSVQLDSLDSEPVYRDIIVRETVPEGTVRITDGTQITVEECESFEEDAQKAADEYHRSNGGDDFDVDEMVAREVHASYEDVGGLHDELARLEETVGLPLRFPEVFNKLGISPPKGVLLYGPPGTGKTLLARAVAAEADANFLSVSGPEAAGSFPVGAAERLTAIFEKAQEETPTILFIDEIDAVAQNRDGRITQNTREGVTQLLTLMDGLEDRGDVVVIAATNRLTDLDGALRRGGRFTREIEIGIPNAEERLEILKIHTRGMSLADDVDLEEFAEATHGYVGADLESLVKEAGLAAVRRVVPMIDFESDALDASVLNRLTVTTADLKEGIAETSPSGMRDVAVETPDVSWDEVGGQDDAKHELQKAIEWPLDYTEGYDHLDLDSTTGVLLYGPPGTGKTMMAKAVANETDANFISVKGSELISKWVGESAQNISELFDKARRNAPSILFIDEIDAILPRRSSLNESAASHERAQAISQVLTELDGLESLEDVIVIGTTNQKEAIDPAILRGGRLEAHIEVGPPSLAGREEILTLHTADKPLASDVDMSALAEMTDGFTGADLKRLCSTAAELVLEDILEAQPGKPFEDALENSAIGMSHFRVAYQKVAEDAKSSEASPSDKPVVE